MASAPWLCMFCVVLFVQRAPVTKANQFRRDKWKLHDAGKLVAREHLDKACVDPGPLVERYRPGEIAAAVLCQPFNVLHRAGACMIN